MFNVGEFVDEVPKDCSAELTFNNVTVRDLTASPGETGAFYTHDTPVNLHERFRDPTHVKDQISGVFDVDLCTTSDHKYVLCVVVLPE